MNQDNFIKNIISKDYNISKKALIELVNSKDIALYKKLCSSCDFIFPFVKEKIVKNFVTLVKKENLDTIFLFTQYYCWDFEDMVVSSWLKFACEDLTDKILDLFSTGSQEQKAYCAKYFSKINDPLSIELLEKNSFSDFEPLRSNCAVSLGIFKYKKIIDDMICVIEKNADEFKTLNALEFLIVYNDEKLIGYIVEKALKSPFCVNILAYLLSYYSFETIKNNLSDDYLINIFWILIDNYPENLTLDTIIQYQIFDFVKYFSKQALNQYVKNIFIILKIKFSEYIENEIYNYDLDKDIKLELKNIAEYLSQIDLNLDDINQEIACYSDFNRYNCALEVIKEKKIYSCALELSDLINQNKLDFVSLSKTAQVLKELDKQSLINKEVIYNIDNENVKALVLSLL